MSKDAQGFSPRRTNEYVELETCGGHSSWEKEPFMDGN